MKVDNPYFPLTPGTTFTYQTTDGSERVEVSVTDETRDVMGVTCTVVRSREYEDGELVEETWDWYAQHTDSTVWYFGEDTKEYGGGRVSSTAGSWEAGLDGAQPGIIMMGAPEVGRSYRQEYYEGHAEDMGEVLRTDASATVPFGSFDDLVVIRGWTPLEPGDEELNYYARGVGLVLEVERDKRLELVSLSPPPALAGSLPGSQFLAPFR
ncbi:MAG: hypothetical protein ACE5PT_02415 [Gemmatimonadales bacterium]